MGTCTLVRMFAVILTMTILLPQAAAAQTSLGTLRGTVTDEQRAVLPGATVTVRHVATNTVQSTVTGDRGQFFLRQLHLADVSCQVGGRARQRAQKL